MGISYGGSSSLVTPREDIGLGFDALDLEGLRMGYVGLKIAPVADARTAFGQYRKLSIAQMLQPRKSDRNADAGFKRIDAEFTTANFATVDRGLEMRVDNLDAAIYAEMIEADAVAAMLTRHGVLEAHEQRIVAIIDALSGSATSAASHAFDVSDANITDDFRAYKEAFRMRCGAYPTSMVLDQSMVDALMENTSVLDKFVGSSGRTAKDITLTGLAAALGLDEVVPANAVKNTVAAPKAISLATTWPQAKALLYRSSMAPPVVAAQFMRTIHFSGAGSRIGCSFEEYEDPRTDGRIIRARMMTTEDIIHAEAGLVITGIKT